jgi:hypothetical protein
MVIVTRRCNGRKETEATGSKEYVVISILTHGKPLCIRGANIPNEDKLLLPWKKVEEFHLSTPSRDLDAESPPSSMQ